MVGWASQDQDTEFMKRNVDRVMISRQFAKFRKSLALRTPMSVVSVETIVYFNCIPAVVVHSNNAYCGVFD